jgi:hypothetical protein
MRLLESQTAGELEGGMKPTVEKVRREDKVAERGAWNCHRRGSGEGNFC